MKKRIVIHCSAGPPSQKADAIVAFHTRPKAKGGLGWKNPGYHYIIEADGRLRHVLDEKLIANGAKGFNADSIHICYTGGIGDDGRPADTRTPSQRRALTSLIDDIRRRRGNIPVVGHRDLSPDLNGNGRVDPWERIKECPCFDAIPEYN